MRQKLEFRIAKSRMISCSSHFSRATLRASRSQHVPRYRMSSWVVDTMVCGAVLLSRQGGRRRSTILVLRNFRLYWNTWFVDNESPESVTAIHRFSSSAEQLSESINDH